MFFIIRDMQGGDKMACLFLSYLNKINRLCRKCDVQGKDSGNPYIKCNNIIIEDIQKWLKMILNN